MIVRDGVQERVYFQVAVGTAELVPKMDGFSTELGAPRKQDQKFSAPMIP